jgi:hypothetical protein
MLRALSELSLSGGILLFVVIPGVVSALLALAVRRAKSIELLRENNEFAAIMYPVIALVYGVFLAFAVVIVWERFTDAEESSYREVAALGELWRDAQVFPPEARDHMHEALAAYTQAVQSREWPAMSGASADTISDTHYDALWAPYYAYEPGTETEKAFYTKSLDQLNTVGTSRQERLMYSASEMHPMVWSFLLFGAIVSVSTCYFLGTKHLWTHALICAALTSLIGFSLLLIMSLQYPFGGPSGIRSDAYADLLKTFGG